MPTPRKPKPAIKPSKPARTIRLSKSELNELKSRGAFLMHRVVAKAHQALDKAAPGDIVVISIFRFRKKADGGIERVLP